MTVNVLVLSGDGLNCERESARAFNYEDTKSRIIHINDLIESPATLHDYDIFFIPGGFSFGDDLGSAKVLASKIRMFLLPDLHEFIRQRKPVLGVCNGFQALIKLGVFNSKDHEYKISLTQNSSGKFINRWEEFEVKKTNCVWIPDSLSSISMPIRHGEGRFKGADECVDKLIKENQVVFKYSCNPNGSDHSIAGICDPSGVVLGLMPHPESATNSYGRPLKHKSSQLCDVIFKQAINYSNIRNKSCQQD
jgi:phosphoribosylformylglycinamidine synthase